MRRHVPFVLALLAGGCRPADPPEPPGAVVRRHLAGSGTSLYAEAALTERSHTVLDSARGARLMDHLAPFGQHLRGFEAGEARVEGDSARVRVRLVLPRYKALLETAADDSTGRRLGRAASAELDRGVQKGPALRASVAYTDARVDSLFHARRDLRVDTTLDVVLVRTPGGWRIVRDYVTG